MFQNEYQNFLSKLEMVQDVRKFAMNVKFKNVL